MPTLQQDLKETKRHTEWNAKHQKEMLHGVRLIFLKDATNHRLNLEDGEIWFDNHIKIDNTNLHPDEVADMVIEQFQLVANEKEEKEYRFGV